MLPGDGRHVLAVANVVYERGPAEAYLFPLVADAGALRPAAEGDGTLRALAGAIAEGRTIPALPSVPEVPRNRPRPARSRRRSCAVRPSGLRDLEPGGAPAVSGLAERPLGMDQSNTSVVLGERLLLKAYRWLQPGLNPDLELVAYLTEEAGFTAVPPLAGYAEVVSRSSEPATVALLQAFVADAADAYESLAETLTDWLLAPGSVSVEFATEIAADIGALSAGLHAALAAAHGVPGFEPRPATRDELRGWHEDARTQLDRALDITPGEAGRVLRELAPRIAEELTIFEALPTEPLVTRVHGDYHLGQVLAAPDGFRIVDFEGEPTRGLEERRAHRSPLRDVASMLRSFDHVGRSAGRRAEERNGGPVPRSRSRSGGVAAALSRAVPRGLPGRAATGRRADRDRPGAAQGLRDREGVLRVRLRGHVPAGVAVGADRGDARPDGDLVTTDRAAALLEDVLGEPTMLAGLLDAYGATGGPLSELPALERPGPGRLRRPRQLSIRRARCRRAASGGGRAGVGGVRLGRRRHAAVPGHGPRGDLGVGEDARNRRRGRAPSRDQPRRRGHEPAGVTARRSGRRRAAAARRRRNVRRVVANVPRHDRRAEPARRSPARARGPTSPRFGRLSKGLDAVLEGRGAWLATTAELFDGADADRRHRTGEQPGTGRAGRTHVPGGAAPACLGARGGRLARTPRSTPRSRVTGPCSCRGRPTPGGWPLSSPGGAGRRSPWARVEAHDHPVPLPAGAPTRFLTPAVADILAAELWSRASGTTP